MRPHLRGPPRRNLCRELRIDGLVLYFGRFAHRRRLPADLPAPAQLWICGEDSADEGAVTSSDIDDSIELSEVITLDDRGKINRRHRGHRRVESGRISRMGRKILEELRAVRALKSGLSGHYRVVQIFPCSPKRGRAEHYRQVSDRFRRIDPQGRAQ